MFVLYLCSVIKNNLKLYIMKNFSILNEKLEVINTFKTRAEAFDYADSLPNFGRGFILFT